MQASLWRVTKTSMKSKMIIQGHWPKFFLERQTLFQTKWVDIKTCWFLLFTNSMLLVASLHCTTFLDLLISLHRS